MFPGGTAPGLLTHLNGDSRRESGNPKALSLLDVSRVKGSRASPRVVQLNPVNVASEEEPLRQHSDRELRELVRSRLHALGSIAVGRPNRGRLRNGVRLEDGEAWVVINRKHAFGTEEAVTAIQAAARSVHERFPGAPKLLVGDLSRAGGGYIRPHKSHQTGLDVDLGYYYLGARRWYTPATPENLDRERTWALVKALIAEGDVEFIFMDRSIQALLRDHALSKGESPEFLDGLFQASKGDETIIRHRWGHRTHFHVRFFGGMSARVGEVLQKRLGLRAAF